MPSDFRADRFWRPENCRTPLHCKCCLPDFYLIDPVCKSGGLCSFQISVQLKVLGDFEPAHGTWAGQWLRLAMATVCGPHTRRGSVAQAVKARITQSACRSLRTQNYLREIVSDIRRGHNLTYLSALNVRETYFFETSLDFHWTTRRYGPEDRILRNHSCEKLKSKIPFISVASCSFC
jgi:hypothetical protein